jgi:CheY-specific phosphatase CheX
LKLEIIQPFINAADAVLGHNLRCSTRVDHLSMDTHEYRKHGIAATVTLHGDVEGRIVLDLDPETAHKMAMSVAGGPEEAAAMVNEVVCELANQVIGNAVTVLNDSGYRFRVQPPQLTSTDQVPMGSADVEALVMKFETPNGPVFLNIALQGRKQFAAD